MEKTMIGLKMMCRAAAVALAFAVLTSAPAKAQFGGGGEDTMTQMAPMLNMMKAKLGKKRFAMMMQTMGPMMEKMTEGGGGLGGLGGMMGGGGFGGMGGFGGGGDIMGMMGGIGGGEMMAMVPQLVSMANIGGGGRAHRRKRH